MTSCASGGKQPDGLAHPGEHRRRDRAGALGAVGEHRVDRRRVGQQRLVPLAHRGEQLDDRLRHVGLEVAVALAGVRLLELGHGGAGRQRQDREQVGDPRLGLRVGAHLAAGVGHRALDLLHQHRGLVEHPQRAGAADALAHLAGRVLQVLDAGAGRGDVLPGQAEASRTGVEALGEVAGQLEVLALVLADRDGVRAVQEDVGGLQHGVGEQADVAAALLLELRHARRLAEPGQAAEDPAELDVLGHVALREQHAAGGVDAESDELRGGGAGAPEQVRRGRSPRSAHAGRR